MCLHEVAKTFCMLVLYTMHLSSTVSGVRMGRWTYSDKAMNGFARDGEHVLHACSLYHASEQNYTV